MKTSAFRLIPRPAVLKTLAPALLTLGLGFSFSAALAQNTPPAPDVSPPPAAGEEDLTAEYPASRYDKIRVKSPFEFELAKPKPEEAVDPFQDLVLAGYAGSANRVTVYLTNTKTQERMTIPASAEHNETGFRLISVNRGTMLRTTTATLEKGGITKELSFDTKALSSMVASGGSGGATAAPGARPPGSPNPPGAILPGQVRPGGIPNAGARPAAPYVSPTAFVPNRGAAGNPAGLPQANGNGAVPAVNLAGNMVNNGQLPAGQALQAQPAISSPQPMLNGVNAGANANNQPNNQPRRRVVLPTQR